MLWVFWVSVLFLVYTLVGYPLLVWFLALWKPRRPPRHEFWPSVSLIVTARNESATIARKIENSLELHYPQDKLEVIIASDGSEDDTPKIVQSFACRGVRLVDVPERRGKHYAQMLARDVSRGEILVFTDASAYLEADALQKIVSNFSNGSVGSVSSEDRVLKGKGSWLGEGTYIRFEMWLRRLESRVGSLVGLSGSFFAARRVVCEKWHPDQSSDFFVALHSVATGYKAVVDPESLGHYGVTSSDRSELTRKVRTIVHGLDVFFTHLEMLNPLRYGLFSWQLISHKLFRWLAPLAVLACLVASLFLSHRGWFYQLCLFLQLALLGGGLLALCVRGLSEFKVFKLAGFFLLGNAATVIAWLKFCSGERYVSWEPTRRI